MSEVTVKYVDRRKITKRPVERNAFCRGCDCVIPKGTDVIATYSIRNRGQHIYFCLPCAKDIGQLAGE